MKHNESFEAKQLNLFDDTPENEHPEPKMLLIDSLYQPTPEDLDYDHFLVRCAECNALDEVTSDDCYDSNSHWLCEDCLHELECLAEFRNDLADRRMARLPDDCKGSYESELMKQPSGRLTVVSPQAEE